MCGKLSSQNGAELVEFAVTLPVILLIALIFVEFAVALNNLAVLTNASRAAALEAVRGSPEAKSRAAAQNIFNSRIAWYQAGSPAPVVSFDPEYWLVANSPGRPITVTVTHTLDLQLIPNFVEEFLGLDELTLTGRTVMREFKH
jgi:Flp pilus assembly protein TadG